MEETARLPQANYAKGERQKVVTLWRKWNLGNMKSWWLSFCLT